MYSASEIVQRERYLRSARHVVEFEWRLIDKHMRPIRRELRVMSEGGDRRAQYDSTPIHAARNLAAGLYGQMSNPANRWFEFSIMDEDLLRRQRVRQWLAQATSIVLASYGPSMTKFYAEAPSWYEGGAMYGQSPFYSQLRADVGRFHDDVWDMWNVCLVYDEFGELIEFYRAFEMKQHTALRQFGDRLPGAIARETNPAKLFKFIHAVYPNDSDNRGEFQFASDYVSCDGEETVQRRFFEEMPLFAPRWATPVDDDYGQGPAFDALLDAVQLNTLERTNAIVAARLARPPLIAASRQLIKTVQAGPGETTYGAIDRNGRRLVASLDERQQPFIGFELAQQKRDAIRDAFYYSLMTLVGRSGMSATEVLSIDAERARMFAPHSGRWQAEGLTPMTIYRFNRLYQYGQIPQPPEELGGQQFRIIYTSPFAKAQKIQEADASLRFLQGVGLAETLVPGARDNIDADEVVRVLQDGYGAPARVILDERLRDRQRAANQRIQQARAAAEIARDGGQAAASLAQARATQEQAAA